LAAAAWLLASCYLFAAEAPAHKPVPQKSWSVRWQPLRLMNGSPVEFRVLPPARLESLTGDWFRHQVFFSLNPRTRKWDGIAGISLETKPGAYTLSLKGKTATGQEIAFQRKFVVHAARYPSIAVTVPARFTEPSPQQLQEIKKDKDIKVETFRHMEPQRLWSGSFRAPVTARISDLFGTRRVFNGETRSVHEGLDYAALAGTPVAAVNAGTVILARPLFFEGNCVVLDHGQGLLTLYLHLSKFEVKEGEHVKRGQIVGLSGGTGRATGPHLHFAVRWQGIYVNPATLLKLNLP
jgi:murein DD-endopeptidase MepM/ murein hydrolase activator NlpD